MTRFQLVKRKTEIPDDDLVWLAKNGFRPHPAARGDETPTVLWSRMMRAREAGSSSSRGTAAEVRMEQDYDWNNRRYVWTAEAFVDGTWFKGEDPSPEKAFSALEYNLANGIYS